MVGSIPENTGRYALRHISQQEETLKDVASKSALRETPADAAAQTAPAIQSSRDTVTISDEAKKLAEESGGNKTENTNASGISVPQDDEQGSGADRIKQIRKQIEEVKKALQEAQERLAQAQSKNGATQARQGENPEEAALKGAMEALSGSTEAEAIQTEIKMLNQQLMMLNSQLQEATNGGGGTPAGAMGTAGLGGTGESGGKGERISVAA